MLLLRLLLLLLLLNSWFSIADCYYLSGLLCAVLWKDWRSIHHYEHSATIPFLRIIRWAPSGTKVLLVVMRFGVTSWVDTESSHHQRGRTVRFPGSDCFHSPFLLRSLFLFALKFRCWMCMQLTWMMLHWAQGVLVVSSMNPTSSTHSLDKGKSHPLHGKLQTHADTLWIHAPFSPSPLCKMILFTIQIFAFCFIVSWKQCFVKPFCSDVKEAPSSFTHHFVLFPVSAAHFLWQHFLIEFYKTYKTFISTFWKCGNVTCNLTWFQLDLCVLFLAAFPIHFTIHPVEIWTFSSLHFVHFFAHLTIKPMEQMSIQISIHFFSKYFEVFKDSKAGIFVELLTFDIEHINNGIVTTCEISKQAHFNDYENPMNAVCFLFNFWLIELGQSSVLHSLWKRNDIVAFNVPFFIEDIFSIYYYF